MARGVAGGGHPGRAINEIYDRYDVPELKTPY